MATRSVECPHCSSKMHLVYSDTKKSKRYKRETYRCSNLECSYVELWSSTPQWALSPSGQPNPEVSIPFSPFKKSLQVGA